MAYGYNPYYPMQDQLAQLRNNPMQYQPYQPMQQPAQPQPMMQQTPPVMQQPVQALQPMPQPTNNTMIWVQGEAGAMSFLVGNGNTVPLWDSENQTVYIKTVDASGMPSMRVLDYTERTAAQRTPAAAPMPDYVTRAEFQAVVDELEALKAKKCTCTKKTTKEDDAA